ncbi:lactate utilization protein [Ruminococcaceae bacterium OttesenSCG-928-A16]|nr:lactate utilization protein [Ruminococcaceae bacterium OttesenSCG-928-A16]
MDSSVQKVMDSLEANNIKPYFVKTKQEVAPLVAQILNPGDVVTVGGSASLFETGVIDHLRSGRYTFLDRYAPGLTEEDIDEIYCNAMKADAYFCSSNAVTQNGELYNVDGKANRIGAIAYGPKTVIMVVGTNKIVADLDAAIHRVKTITAPEICQRRNIKTYCREKGHCRSIANGQPGMTAGCGSPERVCCSYLVTGKQRTKDRIKVILVDESLGY